MSKIVVGALFVAVEVYLNLCLEMAGSLVGVGIGYVSGALWSVWNRDLQFNDWRRGRCGAPI